MASFVNSFALLGDGEPSTSTTTAKKKKSKKSKRSDSTALPPSGANEAVAPTPAASSPEEDHAADDGFQLAGRLSRRSSTGSAKPSTPASNVKHCTLAEGVQDLELAARETRFSQSADRVSQWKSWQQRVEDRNSETFTDPSAKPMIYSTFGDVLLLSRALEITVQLCLEAPFPDKYDLASLAGVIFAAHPSFAKHDTLDALFSAIIQLGKLMPTSDSKHSIDMLRRARIAVAGAMHVLKEQDPVDSPSSVQSFDSELPDRAATQAQQLEGLGRQISDPLESKSRERKDHMKMVHKALELSKEHLALFHPREGPGHNSNAWRALDALDTLVLHLAGTAESQVANVGKQVQMPKGDEQYAQELSDIRGKIQECEQVLEVLRKQERDLATLVHPEQAYQASSQAAQTNRVAPHASQEQLDCFQYLRECMISNQSPYRNPSGLSAQGLSEGQLSEAAQYFLANLERLLNANLDILTEMRGKAEEIGKSLTRAMKTEQDLLNINAPQADRRQNQQHQHSHQKQLKDCIAAAEKILQESKAEFSHMESYKSQLQLVWSREDVQSWLTLFTSIIADSQKALAAVVEASTTKDQAHRRGQNLRTAPVLSLSHADPLVQILNSPAGPIGSSATTGEVHKLFSIPKRLF
ncbi:TPA: hypothetical protein ACH3X1_004471 [Trebouxia sp. C0004]